MATFVFVQLCDFSIDQKIVTNEIEQQPEEENEKEENQIPHESEEKEEILPDKNNDKEQEEEDSFDSEIQRRINFLNSFKFSKTNTKQQQVKVFSNHQPTCRWRECHDRVLIRNQETVDCNSNKKFLWHMKYPSNNDDPKDCRPAYQTSLRRFENDEFEKRRAFGSEIDGEIALFRRKRIKGTVSREDIELSFGKS